MATFDVEVLSQAKVHALRGAWPPEKLRRVLTLADAEEFTDVAEGDLEDMCLMSLQDMGVQRAGEVVLEVVFGGGMRAGVRQNLVDDLQEDQPWDDFANVTQQRGIFVAVCLLQKAFPTRFGTPDASEVTMKVQAQTDAGLRMIEAREPAWLVRLLAYGLDKTTFVHRLYEEELGSGSFTEAAGLVWDAASAEAPGDDAPSRAISVTASSQFIGNLQPGQKFRAVV